MTEGIKCLAASNAFHCVFFQAIGQNNLTFEMLLSDVSHNKKASLILQKKKWKAKVCNLPNEQQHLNVKKIETQLAVGFLCSNTVPCFDSFIFY